MPKSVFMKNLLSLPGIKSYLSDSRVARFATVNKDGTAHIVPIVYVNNSRHLYFVIDKKRKGPKLRRIENIKRTRQATLLIDKYSEDWRKLSFVMIYSRAIVLGKRDSHEKAEASRLLKRKYAQYSSGRYFPDLAEDSVFVRLTPVKIAHWSQILRNSLL